MIIGMSTACFFPNIYNEQAVEEIGKMRIENIEVFFSTLSEYKKAFVKELKQRSTDYNINIYSIHALSLQFEPQLFSTHKRARQDSLDIYEQVLEAGAELGAKVYVFHGPAHVKRARKLTLNYSYVGECVDPLAELAKSYGIKLSYENVHWCWYAEPKFPVKLQPHINTDNLYFTLDIKQAAQSGYSPIEYLHYTKDKLVNIHICDYQLKNDGDIKPVLPFDGDVNWNEFRDALRSNRYNEGLMLEVYSSNYSNCHQLQNNFNKVKDFFTD